MRKTESSVAVCLGSDRSLSLYITDDPYSTCIARFGFRLGVSAFFRNTLLHYNIFYSASDNGCIILVAQSELLSKAIHEPAFVCSP